MVEGPHGYETNAYRSNNVSAWSKVAERGKDIESVASHNGDAGWVGGGGGGGACMGIKYAIRYVICM